MSDLPFSSDLHCNSPFITYVSKECSRILSMLKLNKKLSFFLKSPFQKKSISIQHKTIVSSAVHKKKSVSKWFKVNQIISKVSKIVTSNDGIAGNGRIMVYQCLYLPMFIYMWIFIFPLIFFHSFYSGLSCSSDVNCLFLTEFCL